MKKTSLRLLLCFQTAAVCSAADLCLVREGEPLAEIVIAEQPARMAEMAAHELRNYIARISGAELPVVTAPSPGELVQIYVGRSVYTDAMGFDDEPLIYGAYRIQATQKHLVLFGRDRDFNPVEPWARGRDDQQRVQDELDRMTGEKWGITFNHMGSLYRYYNKELGCWLYDEQGSMNAVNSFLHDLGLRRYLPGEIGECLPEIKTVSLKECDRTVHPDFAFRELHQGSKQFFACDHAEITWQLSLGMHPGYDIMGLKPHCHGMSFAHQRPEMMAEHPEYYAIWGGKRMTDEYRPRGRPCLSSEGLFETHVRYIRDMFRIYDLPVVDISPSDGYATLCQCEKCRDKGTPERGYAGSLSDYVWTYLDRVAREIYRTNPDKKVRGLAYSAYRLPPTSIQEFSPNLVVTICQSRLAFDDEQTSEGFRQSRKEWLEKLPSQELFTYDYYLQAMPGRVTEGVPVFIPHIIAEDLRSLQGLSRGEFVEVYRQGRNVNPQDELALAFNHLNLYVTAKLYWDVNLDLEALLSEYVDKFYGPAAKPMAAFIEYAEKNWKSATHQTEIIDRLLSLYKTARAAAGEEGLFASRIALIGKALIPLEQQREKLAKGREDVPVIQVPRCDTSRIVIDGKLDEEIWQQWPLNRPLLDLITGKQPRQKGAFRVIWGDDSLYFAIICHDDAMEGLDIATAEDDDPNIWLGDVVEIMLETQSHAYYQFVINPAGALLELDRKDGQNYEWSSGATVAASRSENCWTIEARIPLAGENQEELDPLNGVSGRRPSKTYPWYFNIFRQRKRDGTTEFSAFSPTGKSGFAHPDKFGRMYTK